MSRAIEILHQDEHLLIALKPAGMLSIATPNAQGLTLPQALARQGFKVLPVHRLDREVSGCMVFALDEPTRVALDALFRERALVKTYWAMAQGRVRPAQGLWKYPILESGAFARVSSQGKRAETRYATLASHSHTTELEIELITGRYNQIRLHAAHAGFPLVGERKYARGKDSPLPFKSRRVALHAWRLEFAHPAGGRPVSVEAPLPADLVELRERVSSGSGRD